MDVDLRAGSTSAWQRLRERYGAYELLLPGDPSFICQPHICDAHCCRKFSVSVGLEDRVRMRRETGMADVEFLECDDGEPIALPMLKPFLLRRAGNGCAMLGEHLACGAYPGRPDACRQYPYQVLFADREGLPVRPAIATARALVAAPVDGTITPLLVRHVECPGFTGPSLSTAGWRETMLQTFKLQGGAVL
jgi:Fe-S-cluster containining protein